MSRLPLVYQGETVGQFVLAPRQGEVQLTRVDRHLLEDLARHAGVIAHAVRLTSDLLRSRERIVVAREEEHRRLRRDLHDPAAVEVAAYRIGVEALTNVLRHAQASKCTIELRRERDLVIQISDDGRGASQPKRRAALDCAQCASVPRSWEAAVTGSEAIQLTDMLMDINMPENH